MTSRLVIATLSLVLSSAQAQDSRHNLGGTAQKTGDAPNNPGAIVTVDTDIKCTTRAWKDHGVDDNLQVARLDHTNNAWSAQKEKGGRDLSDLRLQRVTDPDAQTHMWLLQKKGADGNFETRAIMRDTDHDGDPDEAEFLMGSNPALLTQLKDPSVVPAYARVPGQVRSPFFKVKLDNSWGSTGGCKSWLNPIGSLMQLATTQYHWEPSMGAQSSIGHFVDSTFKANSSLPVIQSTTKGNRSSDATTSVVDEDTARKICTLMASQDYIPFRYPEDGCYARAQEMSMLLEHLGIDTAKVYVEGDLHVETKNAANGSVDWWYHVAPSIKVRDKTGHEKMVVIDPSIYSYKPGDPLPSVDDWVKLQTSAKPQTPKVYFTDRFHYTPNDRDDKMTDWSEYDVRSGQSTMENYRTAQTQRQSTASVKKTTSWNFVGISAAVAAATSKTSLDFSDTVRSLTAATDGSMKVTFLTHAAIYKINAGATASELRTRLEKGLQSKAAVKVRVNTNTLVIENVEKL